jgi:hypothetical protein
VRLQGTTRQDRPEFQEKWNEILLRPPFYGVLGSEFICGDFVMVMRVQESTEAGLSDESFLAHVLPVGLHGQDQLELFHRIVCSTDDSDAADQLLNSEIVRLRNLSNDIRELKQRANLVIRQTHQGLKQNTSPGLMEAKSLTKDSGNLTDVVCQCVEGLTEQCSQVFQSQNLQRTGRLKRLKFSVELLNNLLGDVTRALRDYKGIIKDLVVHRGLSRAKGTLHGSGISQTLLLRLERSSLAFQRIIWKLRLELPTFNLAEPQDEQVKSITALLETIEERILKREADYNEEKSLGIVRAVIVEWLNDWHWTTLPVSKHLVGLYGELTGASQDSIEKEFGSKVLDDFFRKPASFEPEKWRLGSGYFKCTSAETVFGKFGDMLTTAGRAIEITRELDVPPLLVPLKELADEFSILVCGSTLIHENRVFAEAYWDCADAENSNGSLLFLAPRSVSWLYVVEEQLQRAGFTPIRYSLLKNGDACSVVREAFKPVLVLDSQGWLFSAYHYCHGVLMGGGVLGPNSSNWVEPLALGLPTWVGSHHDQGVTEFKYLFGFAPELFQVITEDTLSTVFKEWFDGLTSGHWVVEKRASRLRAYHDCVRNLRQHLRQHLNKLDDALIEKLSNCSTRNNEPIVAGNVFSGEELKLLENHGLLLNADKWFVLKNRGAWSDVAHGTNLPDGIAKRELEPECDQYFLKAWVCYLFEDKWF